MIKKKDMANIIGIFKGMWKNGVQDGEGEIYDPKKNRSKKGIWKEGKRIQWVD